MKMKTNVKAGVVGAGIGNVLGVGGTGTGISGGNVGSVFGGVGVIVG
jgi:hypothetical protein